MATPADESSSGGGGNYIENADGQKLFTRSWEPEDSPKAVVFIVHGVGEHSGRYDHLGQHLQSHQYAVFSHDHVGHGKSEGERVYIETFQTYVRDVFQHIELLKDRFSGLPFFLWGHSMGGSIAALAVLDKPDMFTGVVFSSPGLDHGANFILRAATRIVATFAPRAEIMTIDPNLISRIPAEVEAYINDPLVWHGGLKARWITAHFDAVDRFTANVRQINLPFIVLHGDADGIVDIRAAEVLYNRAGSEDKTFERFEGGYHELLNDLERDRFKELTTDWLDSRVS